jgi:hypothetical protein
MWVNTYPQYFPQGLKAFLKFVITLKCLAECYLKNHLMIMSRAFSYSQFVIFFPFLTVKTVKSVALYSNLFSVMQQPPRGSSPPLYWSFTIVLKRSSFSRTTLDEWSSWHRDLYLKTHSTHKRQTCMLPVGFKPVVRASERPHTHALDCVAAYNGVVV